jgi:hypothetical protein
MMERISLTYKDLGELQHDKLEEPAMEEPQRDRELAP